MTDALDIYANLPAAFAAVAPSVRPSLWAPPLGAAMRGIGIITAAEASEFLGNCAEESGGFTVLRENLEYSIARLRAVWPSRFPTDAAAAPYAFNPVALADMVYGGRLGNRPGTTDAVDYRGDGPIQLTGYYLHSLCAAAFGMPLDAAFVAYLQTPEGGARMACWYWSIRKTAVGETLLHLSDREDLVQATIDVTRAINGGLGNLQTRETLVARAFAEFSRAPAAAAA